MNRICFLAFALGVAGSVSAFTFSGPSTYLVAPQSNAPGTVTNNLLLVDTLGGFTVTGQFLVNVNAGTHSGTLVEYEVERPIDPTYPSGLELLSTSFTGFIDAPVGALSGILIGNSYTFNYGTSNTPVTFPYPGPGSWTFNLLNSTAFLYTIGGGQFLRQRFIVTYDYTSTSAGLYIVDLPATTHSQAVPEPATLAILGLGTMLLARRRRKS